MIRICTGWTFEPHPAVVLKVFGDTPGVSHGLCDACHARVNAALDAQAVAEEKDQEVRRRVNAYAIRERYVP